MAAPSRAQITATIALPTYTVQIDQGAGYVTVTSADVQSIGTKLETTSNIDNAFAFGTVANAGATVSIADTTEITNWRLAKIRILYGFSTSDKIIAFEGVIVKRQHNAHMYQYECAGFDYIIERTKIYTNVFYRRPIATKTSITSVEDYTIPGSTPGVLNIIMFAAGGRPYEQPGYVSDPLFKFWYSFDQSIVAPKYSWVSADNAWEEVYRLVKAAGGQFYQDKDGVFYYKQPLTFGYVETGATLYHFTESTYQTIQEEASAAENVNTIKSAFVSRIVQPMQQVYESSEPQLIPATLNNIINLEMQYPIYEYGVNVTSANLVKIGESIKATYLDGRDATLDWADFTGTLTVKAAQLVTIDFDNQTGEPIALNKVTIQGRPVTVGSEGIASYTNGVGDELQLEDNIYIQSFAQAYRLVRMVYDFYHVNRSIITLSGVGYDPDRYLSEVVELTYAEWGITAARHRIISLEYTNGATMTVRLAPIEGLITRDDVFICGNTYTDGTTKMVSY